MAVFTVPEMSTILPKGAVALIDYPSQLLIN